METTGRTSLRLSGELSVGEGPARVPVADAAEAGAGAQSALDAGGAPAAPGRHHRGHPHRLRVGHPRLRRPRPQRRPPRRRLRSHQTGASVFHSERKKLD